MRKIYVSHDCGLSMDNMPAEFYCIIQNMEIMGSTLVLSITNSDCNEFLIMIIEHLNAKGKSTSVRHDDSSSYLTTTAESINNNILNDDDEDDDDDDDDDEEIHALDNSYREVDVVMPVPIINEAEGGQSIVDTYVRLSNEQAVITMASMFGDSRTSNAKNLSDKIESYNQLWSKLLIMKREIDELSSITGEDPIIASIMKQIEDLKSNDENLVDDIFISNTSMIVKTKHLDTDIEVEGQKKSIGKMAIIINLQALLSTGESRISDPIVIKNLTRTVSRQGSEFECGHVKTYNNSSHVCFGGYNELMFNAMAIRDIGAIIEICTRLIKNPNISDGWGSAAKLFPPVTEGVQNG